MRKKLATLLLSLALIVCTVFGLAACGGKKKGDGGTDVKFDFTEEGSAVNGPTPKETVASREDPRAASYTLYEKDGTKVEDYISLANAANDAIDLGIGSYVTRKGDTTKMFHNPGAYDKESLDCYWYYENGVSLDTFDCYDENGTMTYLRDSNLLSIRTQTNSADETEAKTWASQSFNSFTLFDKAGGTDLDVRPYDYEFPLPLDAAMLTFIKKYPGLTRMTYEIDLSDMKVTPAYTTSDECSDVYAFMGYYMWADFYVLNTGIACDTKTGNWYPYLGSSRNQSAGDTVYSKDNCVMTSTWDAAEGCFKPDAKKATFVIETKMLEDENGPYQVNDFSVKLDTGAGYSRRFTEATINQFFPNQPIKPENVYMFVTGLDVKNEESDTGVKNVDFFNGAKFENITVTRAKAYMPTEEEMSDVDYGAIIENRGQEVEMMYANGGSDTIRYGLLTNNVCSSYQFKDGKDVYSFSYDLYGQHNPLSSDKFGRTSKPYQDKIDALKNVTQENAVQYSDRILEIEPWYGEGKRTESTLDEGIFNALDFAPYLSARQVLQSVSLSEEAQKVVDDFKKLTPLKDYKMAGWVGTGDGFLKTDLDSMKIILDAYNALDNLMKKAVFFHVPQSNFEAWEQFVKDMAAVEAHEKFNDTGMQGYNPSNTKVTVTPLVAMQQIAYWTLNEANGLKYANNKKIEYEDGPYPKAIFVYECVEYLKGLGIPVPTFYTETLNSVDYEKFAYNFKGAATTIELGSKWAKAYKDNVLLVAPEITAEDAALLTQYWSAGWVYTDQLDYNLGNVVKGEWTYGRFDVAMSYHKAAGSPVTGMKDCMDAIRKVLSAHGYTLDEVTYYRSTATSIEAKAAVALELTAEGLAFKNAWQDIGPFTSYTCTGWAPANWKPGDPVEDTVKHNLYVDTYRVPSIAEQYAALVEDDKTVLATIFGETIEADFAEWATFKTELEALQANETFKSSAVILDNDAAYWEADKAFDEANPDAPLRGNVNANAFQAFAHIMIQASKIRGGVIGEGKAPNIMNFDDTFYPSIYILNCREAFEGAGLTLPKAVVALLDAIKYDDFYEAYNSILQTVKVAEYVKGYTTESGATGTALSNEILANISDELLAALNKYWANNGMPHSQYRWNFYNNKRLGRDLVGARVDRIIELAGGTQTETVGEKVVRSKFGVYVDIVVNFLNDNGYTTKKAQIGLPSETKVEENDWGVTDEAITKSPVATEPVTPAPETPAA